MNSLFRIGLGYDIHPFKRGRDLILGGIKIPSKKGLFGHSDADCLSHAIADSLFGAVALPDIGHFFPDNDPSLKGMDSQLIIKKASEKIREKGYEIENIDTVLIAQEPKLSKYFELIQKKLAQTLNIEVNQVGVKATTNEKIGSLGKSKGIAAYATSLLKKVK